MVPRIVGAGEQEGGEATLDRAEGDLLYAGNDIGDAPAEVGEDEAAKSGGGLQCRVEGGLGDNQGAHRGLGEALGRVVVAREDAAGGEHTGLARQDAVEQRLASALADDLHPHAAFQEQYVVLAGGPGAEHRLVGRHGDHPSAIQHLLALAVAGRQRREQSVPDRTFAVHDAATALEAGYGLRSAMDRRKRWRRASRGVLFGRVMESPRCVLVVVEVNNGRAGFIPFGWRAPSARWGVWPIQITQWRGG